MVQKLSVMQNQEKTLTPNKEALEAAVKRFESELKRIENKETNDTARALLSELDELSAAMATMQDMMNIVWKRSEQMREQIHELKEKTS